MLQTLQISLSQLVGDQYATYLFFEGTFGAVKAHYEHLRQGGDEQTAHGVRLRRAVLAIILDFAQLLAAAAKLKLATSTRLWEAQPLKRNRGF